MATPNPMGGDTQKPHSKAWLISGMTRVRPSALVIVVYLEKTMYVSLRALEGREQDAEAHPT